MHGPLPLPCREGSGFDRFDDGRPLQDRLPSRCFGCGTLGAHGLQVKSRWEDDVFVCVWQPKAEHIGHPGVVYGGTIASIVDCHAVWASLSLHCHEAGHDLNDGPPPFVVVTRSIRVDFRRPASVARALELRARVVEHGPRKSLVACSVHQGSVQCAVADVVTIRVPETA